MRSETRKRSLTKALSWRVLATLVTMGAALIITGELSTAAEIGLLDTVVKFFIYYGHERVWERVQYGRLPPPEYQI